MAEVARVTDSRRWGGELEVVTGFEKETQLFFESGNLVFDKLWCGLDVVHVFIFTGFIIAPP